jgi:hypothetical protein
LGPATEGTDTDHPSNASTKRHGAIDPPLEMLDDGTAKRRNKRPKERHREQEVETILVGNGQLFNHELPELELKRKRQEADRATDPFDGNDGTGDASIAADVVVKETKDADRVAIAANYGSVEADTAKPTWPSDAFLEWSIHTFLQ